MDIKNHLFGAVPRQWIKDTARDLDSRAHTIEEAVRAGGTPAEQGLVEVSPQAQGLLEVARSDRRLATKYRKYAEKPRIVRVLKGLPQY